MLHEGFPQQTMDCGLKNDKRGRRGKRVIGGNVARENAWPWLVNMIDKNDSLQYCSGAIIDEQWVLTTAHCFLFYGSNNSVTYFALTNYEYIVADHKYNHTDRHEYTVEPSQLFIHPKYKLADNSQPGMLPYSSKIQTHVSHVCAMSSYRSEITQTMIKILHDE